MEKRRTTEERYKQIAKSIKEDALEVLAKYEYQDKTYWRDQEIREKII